MMNLLSVVRALRIPEVFLLSGAYLFAGLLLELQPGRQAIRFFAGWPVAFAALLCIWNLNSFTDYRHDTRNPRLRGRQLERRGGYLLVAVASGLAGVALAGPGLRWTFAGLVAAGVLYSVPGVGGKHVPVWGSVLHVVLAGLLVHLAAVTLGVSIDAELAPTVLLSALLVSGHLVQELCDESADRAAGICTFPVIFGSRVTLVFAACVPVAAMSVVERFPGPVARVLTAALVMHTATVAAGVLSRSTDLHLRVQRVRAAYRTIWVLTSVVLLVIRWR